MLFYDRLRQALAQAKRNQWTVGVMLIDVDRFKNVNDTLGHAVGDQLLQQVSERLTRSVRAGDTVGRLGGDEFAVVLSNLATAAGRATSSRRRSWRASRTRSAWTAAPRSTSPASIGITLYPDDGTDQDTLHQERRRGDVPREGGRAATPTSSTRRR